MRVWIVEECTGEYSDFTMTVESVWATEAGAVSHLVNDVGAAYAGVAFGQFTWECREIPDWAMRSHAAGTLRRELDDYAEVTAYYITPHHLRGSRHGD